jgi:hypothetical protein
MKIHLNTQLLPRSLPAGQELSQAARALSEWFAAEFGSTQSREITQSDFSSASSVEN